MTDYVETYKLPVAGTFGIEDHEEPGDHFFPDDYKSGERKRFCCWVGGCGIGNFETRDAAYRHLESFAKQRLNDHAIELKQRLLLVEEELTRVQDASGKKFKIIAYKKPTGAYAAASPAKVLGHATSLGQAKAMCDVYFRSGEV